MLKKKKTLHASDDTLYRLYQDGVPTPLVTAYGVKDFSRAVWHFDREFYLKHQNLESPKALSTRIRNGGARSIIANRTWLVSTRYIRVGDIPEEALNVRCIRSGITKVSGYLVDAECGTITKTETLTEATELTGRTFMGGVLGAYSAKRWYLNRFFITDSLAEAEQKLREGVTSRRKNRRVKRIIVYREGTDIPVTAFATSSGFSKYYGLKLTVARTAVSLAGDRLVKVPNHPNLILNVEYHE